MNIPAVLSPRGGELSRWTMLYVRIIRRGFHHCFKQARLTRWTLLGRPMDKTFFEGDDIMVPP